MHGVPVSDRCAACPGARRTGPGGTCGPDDELAAGAVLIDIRPVEQRQRDGELTGAIIIDRNVLEWRLDPTSPDRLPVASSADIRYILVCNQGYSSSLAAATLRDLGLSRATDLVGGFQALLAYQESS
jgi:rhodanese-related sulfurtransferase